MRIRSFRLQRPSTLLAACFVASVGTGLFAVDSHVAAEGEQGASDAASSKTETPDKAVKKKHRAHKLAPRPDTATNAAAKETAAQPNKETAAKDDVTAPIAKPVETAPNTIDFAEQLTKAGASLCRNQVNTLATATMGAVEKFNTVSSWSQIGGDKRAVSVSIGQKYATGSAVPFGLTQVISAPNQQGGCDGFSLQIFPSPLSCDKLRDTIKARRGQQIGDLAGIPLMQDAAERTMLVPTAADTCVLVATKSFYTK